MLPSCSISLLVQALGLSSRPATWRIGTNCQVGKILATLSANASSVKSLPFRFVQEGVTERGNLKYRRGHNEVTPIVDIKRALAPLQRVPSSILDLK